MCELVVKSYETSVVDILRWGVRNRLGSVRAHNKISEIRKKQMEAEEALGVVGKISEWTVQDVENAMRAIARGLR